tara:strand:+ start:980 stop:2248 length:1269 start_codon:yes stop_codon:yes gene_type:complete
MGHIVDRRRNWKGKSTGNRRKFIKRVEGQIKKALPDVISDGSIEDMATGKGKVKVPIKGITEPKFKYNGETGKKEYIVPGNDRFQQGDKVPRPRSQGGGGEGRKGSKDGEGQDEFTVEISREEFLKYFFEDLELPDLLKNELEEIVEEKIKRTGYTKYSTPSRLNVTTSVKNSLARKIGIKSIFEKKIKELKEELENCTDKVRIKEIEKEIKSNEVKKNAIPFLDDVDLRYNNFEIYEEPSTRAVMFCIMDVSMSMGPQEKTMAKKFFTLLYMFLHKKYETIKLVFIRHHSEAKEVSEEEFFNSKETGGTVVAEAMDLTAKIIRDRYLGTNWNIYVTQVSDGDAWGQPDCEKTYDIIQKHIINHIRYFAYIETSRYAQLSQLYTMYTELDKEHSNFSMQRVFQESQIWSVFQKLFEKNKTRV